MASDVMKEEKLAVDQMKSSVEVVVAAVAERSSASVVLLGAFDHQRTTTFATDKFYIVIQFVHAELIDQCTFLIGEEVVSFLCHNQ